MEFLLKNKVKLQGIRPETRNASEALLTLRNPKYEEAKRMGRYTGNLSRTLEFFEETQGDLVCPRGAAVSLYGICQEHGEIINVIDNRLELAPVDFEFQGSLWPLQEQAINGVVRHDHGTLSAPTGSGKTAMGLYMIAQRKQPSVVICHTKELLFQWISAIETFLGIPADQVGIVGNGKFSLGDRITVAMVQTLYNRLEDVVPHIGHLIVDECHRTPSRTFTEAVSAFPAKYRLGLTATPWRRDKLSQVIFWYIGDVTGEIDKRNLVDQGNLCQADAVFIPTDFSTLTDASEFYARALSELTQDEQRNRLICDTVIKQNGHGISLILSDRKEHCNSLSRIFEKEHGVKAAVLTGSTSDRERVDIIHGLKEGRHKYLIATGQLIGEGFDLPNIATMSLTTPIKFSGRLIQYIGRALRPAPGKDRALILDFVDELVPVFNAGAKHRERVYQSEGLTKKVNTPVSD